MVTAFKFCFCLSGDPWGLRSVASQSACINGILLLMIFARGLSNQPLFEKNVNFILTILHKHKSHKFKQLRKVLSLLTAHSPFVTESFRE